WGQGIMTEAARALAEAFFQTHDGPLFSGWIDGNAGSQNVLAKLGFRETAVSPDYSRYHGRDVSTHWVELSSMDAMPPLKRVEAAR
ncbi:MAG: GNAT family N-acetyltransferase, partial [Pseudomonadota bacterium]